MLLLPSEKDLYFPPEDEEWSLQYIPGGELKVIPGVWGHLAGGGADPQAAAFIDSALREFLTSP